MQDLFRYSLGITRQIPLKKVNELIEMFGKLSFFNLHLFFSRRVWQPDLRSAVVGQFLSLSTTSRLEILFLISCYLLSVIVNICQRLFALKDREDVLSKARLLKRSNIYVSEDLSRYFWRFFLIAKVLIDFDERKPGRHESTELSCRNSYDRSFIVQCNGSVKDVTLWRISK